MDYEPWTIDFSTYLCTQMNHLLENWELKAKEKQKANKQFLQKLQTKRGKGVEKLLPELHEEAFSHIDCLQCAGCCKTISPRFKTPDIKRISKHLGLKESVFIETYLRLDEEGDYVVKRTPCPFLGADNYCGIYDVRPGDCENYPYTDSYDFFKRPNTTFLNSTICPAVYYVLERLKMIMK
jgi:Fe-S-cluster containining protein